MGHDNHELKFWYHGSPYWNIDVKGRPSTVKTMQRNLDRKFIVIVLPDPNSQNAFLHVTNMSSQLSFLRSRQNEQTCPTGAHVQMSTPVELTHTSVKADQLDTPAAASLSLGPLADSLSPSRVQTDTVLPQSSETLMSSCVFHAVAPLFLC